MSNQIPQKMKKILIAICVAGIFFSCKQTTPKIVTAKAPIDSLITNYNNAWNNHDSIAIRNLFAHEALLIDDEIIAKNVDEISATWIKPYYRFVNNISLAKMQEWSSGDRAGFTGTYILNLTMKNAKKKDKIMKIKGTCTMIWMKNDKGDWKIATNDIHSAPGK